MSMYRTVKLIGSGDGLYHIIRKGGDKTLCGIEGRFSIEKALTSLTCRACLSKLAALSNNEKRSVWTEK